MSYVLESQSEFKRLEKQANYTLYDIEREIQHLSELGVNISEHANALDLGCGSGFVSRYLSSTNNQLKVTGLDLSPLNIEQAKNFSQEQYPRIDFKCGNYLNEKFKNFFDLVYVRYVLEHAPEPQLIVNKIYDDLEKGGQAVLIDLDGILFNLVTNNKFVNECLKDLSTQLAVDCYCGRKMFGYASEAGFKDVDFKCEILPLEGKMLIEEIELYAERFENAKDHITQILGSEIRYEKFCRAYLDEMAKPDTFMFYNKFIVRGTK